MWMCSHISRVISTRVLIVAGGLSDGAGGKSIDFGPPKKA